ncbi:MAG TPA: hypothetical protein VG015_00220, partial [Candidatus Dormibacteraeota bacterium]|nr:hypothetical protein [Candidatus Dormibacteraeota bacterium]
MLLDTARALTASLEPEMVVQEVVSSAAQLISAGSRAVDSRASMIRILGEDWYPMAEYDQLGFSLSGRQFSVARHPGILQAVDSLRACTVETADLEADLAPLFQNAGIATSA